MVPAADVVLLVEQDVAPLRFFQRGGQVDPGPQQTHDEGRGDAVRQIDVVPQADGSHQTAAQPQHGRQAGEQQQRGSRQPDPGHCGQWVGSGGGTARRVCRRRGGSRPGNFPEALRRSGPRRGGERSGGRRNVFHRAGQRSALLRGRAQRAHQRYRRRNGHRTQQPEQHHRPQRVGKDLRRPPQQQARQQHREDHGAGRQAHVADRWEPRKQDAHTITSCSGRSGFAARRPPRPSAFSAE